MIDAKALLADLQKLLITLESDLRTRCTNHVDVDQPLREQYAAAKAANRTAQAYEVWRDEQITQAAVAWILGCVFVRFCEDNHLIDPPRLSGPGDRRQRAEDEHTIYFQKHPTHSDREYLQWVFEQVAQLPAMKELFDKRHNPLWALGVSGDGAMALRNFFLRRETSTGSLVHDFTDPAFVTPSPPHPVAPSSSDPTRFLGDLYQDLSESARKKFALLQTPVFVEEFILDRTLMPAIREFGFQTVRMIDPTCGSGHFLLGGFHRLFDLWVKREPGTNVRVLAQRALDGVFGVDLNPFAVAIARFRLLVAGLRACDIRRLADAPGFTIHLASGDSLLHGVIFSQELFDYHPLSHFYRAEEEPKLKKYLGQQYHAVVGNPPYITPKDKALNEAYRENFKSCHMKYSLAVPFFQRFFDLCLNMDSPGFVGMITANSFMKREFGKKLIELYIPRWDLTHVIDTAGAYIPGHATSTVILFGRNAHPVSSSIRTVMGIKGEPIAPPDPSRGQVWSSIVDHIDHPGTQSDFVSVADTAREIFHRHPWSIGGGGAAELKEALDEASSTTLGQVVEEFGYFGIAADDAMIASAEAFRRRHVEQDINRPLVTGDQIRDWLVHSGDCVVFPYREGALVDVAKFQYLSRWLWPMRAVLGNRPTFAGRTYFDEGRPWWEWHQVTLNRLKFPYWIAHASVATHNDFTLAPRDAVLNRHAPMVVFPLSACREDVIGILGLLNCSVTCFWLKQVMNCKGLGGQGGGIKSEHWFRAYEFDGTKVSAIPIPESRPYAHASRLNDLAASLITALPTAVVGAEKPTRSKLDAACRSASQLRGQMIALQEELDWQCYRLYGLLSDTRAETYESSSHTSASTSDLQSVPLVHLGTRRFEIVLARQMASGEVETTWFTRHGATPITEIPAEWPEDYKQVVRRRIEIIETDKNIGLIERPEYKRRWNTEPWAEMQERALRSWLLDRLEGWELQKSMGVAEYGGGGVNTPSLPHADSPSPSPMSSRSLIWNEKEPRFMSVAQLADRVRQDKDFMQVAALYRSREDFDLTKLVAELVEDEAVPALAVLRYKESGLRHRRVWEQVWDLQRLEDAIDARTKLPPTDPQYLTEQQAKAEKKAKVGDIPVPPKYKSADMLPGPIWRLRGKLDVPKERFVSFPHCQRDADQILVITWAGFDHLQQLQAVAAYYMDMKEREGWPPERRMPLLAAMLELLPWVLQWHNAVHPDFGVGLGDYYRDFIKDEAKEMGKTVDEAKAWVPPAKLGRGSKRKVTP